MLAGMNLTGTRSLRGPRTSAAAISLLASLLGLAAVGGCDNGPTPVDAGDDDLDVPSPIDGGGSDVGGLDGGEPTDGGTVTDDCTGSADGAPCVLEGMDDRRAICLGEACVVSTCGDGFADVSG